MSSPAYDSDDSKPKAIDLSHHYADNVKDLHSVHLPNKFQGRPGLVNLDGGVPATDYYPVESISVEYLNSNAFPLSPKDATPTADGVFGWLTSILTGKKASTKTFTIPRYLTDSSATKGAKFELRTALTYSPVRGLAPLEKFIHDWSGRAHKPTFADWNTLITVGATASLGLVYRAFLNPGDGVLADAYAYNFAITQAGEAHGRFASVALDSQGTSAVDLERVLSTWDEKARGFRRPRLLYTQGGISNPTGQVVTSERKKQIYDIAVRYDVLILEDDPYRWQESQSLYVPPGNEGEKARQAKIGKNKTDAEWLDSVTPSFLEFDYQGRVIRIDTFSKTIGPGSRLGYFTSSPSLLRILQYVTEGSTQAPSGIAQAVVGQLLHTFEQDGFTRWLRGISAQYELRRNWSIDVLFKHLHFEKNESTGEYTAYKKVDSSVGMVQKVDLGKSIFSFVPPAGGMFLWFAIHLNNHPSYAELSKESSEAEAKTELAAQLWYDLGEGGVLFRPGELFAVGTPEERVIKGETVIYLRASFSSNSRDELEKGFGIFAQVTERFFR